jgi:hypothetical protein
MTSKRCTEASCSKWAFAFSPFCSAHTGSAPAPAPAACEAPSTPRRRESQWCPETSSWCSPPPKAPGLLSQDHRDFRDFRDRDHRGLHQVLRDMGLVGFGDSDLDFKCWARSVGGDCQDHHGLHLHLALGCAGGGPGHWAGAAGGRAA